MYTYCDESLTWRQVLASGKYRALIREITAGRLTVSTTPPLVVTIPDRFKPTYLTPERERNNT